MVFRFPMDDVAIEVTEEQKSIVAPIYSDEWNKINQCEFTLDVEDVGWFYVADGNRIAIKLYEGYSLPAVELFLNSSVYGAILHQRKILPLHGSCFSYKGSNIMVCGDSGAGKSSLTVSFCLSGSFFITDDISPMHFHHGIPAVSSLSDRIKLWDDSLAQLDIDKKNLENIQEGVEKFYFPMDKPSSTFFPLQQLLLLQVDENAENVSFEEARGAEKLALLRSQVYKPEILLGMPDNDSVYFGQLSTICNAVNITKITRPSAVPIKKLMREVRDFLNY